MLNDSFVRAFLRKQTLRPRKMMELDRIGHEDWDKKKPYDVPTLTAKSTMPDDVDYTDYRFESARLNSFGDWPVPFVDPKKLAAAGFFYTKQKDAVKCFMCSIVLSGWVDGDDPMAEHQRWSGRCRFVRSLPCGNVPIDADPTTIPKMPKCLDTCGLYGVKYMPYSSSDTDPSTEETMKPEINEDIEITVFWDSITNANFTAKLGDVLGSKQPTYASYERRLHSFATWPDTMCQRKEDLAAAGFFYLSGLYEQSDETMCFYCGGCLKNWEPTDDPVEEHVKWFPECKFIKKVIAGKQLKKKDDSRTSSTEQTDHDTCLETEKVTTATCDYIC
ncbi:death-associated inhibitor of apoptosis 1-like isoform X1 [Temnothorax americanus]|uniref:death-associated inhibitor of apoptosis 1-like isoform X1 n=2 Tax=Temnothorax americanus TaxID=1964332 RepID=UPI0040691C32